MLICIRPMKKFLKNRIIGKIKKLCGSIVGMLVSIPAVAAAKSLFVYYFEKKTGRIIVSEDGVIFKGEPSGTEVNPVADATGEFYVPEITPLQGKHRK